MTVCNKCGKSITRCKCSKSWLEKQKIFMTRNCCESNCANCDYAHKEGQTCIQAVIDDTASRIKDEIINRLNSFDKEYIDKVFKNLGVN